MHRSLRFPSTRNAVLVIAALLWAAPAAAQPLSFLAAYQSTPIQHASAVVLSDDGRHLYTAGDSRLALLERSASSGALSHLGALDLGELRLEGDFIDLALSPDGRHLYVAADGLPGNDRPAIGVFARDLQTGELDFAEHYSGASFGSANFKARLRIALSPDGRHLYALSRSKQRLLVFERNGTSGALRLVTSLSGSGGRFGSEALAISADGNLVVTVGEPLLSAFARDATTGRLSALGTLDDTHDPSAGATALEGYSVAISPEGRHLYALTRTRDFPHDDHLSVARFERDPASGAPRFVDIAPSTPITFGTDLELSPDGKNLYATADWGGIGGMSTVTTFRREVATGRLIEIQIRYERTQYVQGSFARAAAVSPDGRHVYVGSFERRAVAVFRRSQGNGRLTLANQQSRGVNGLGGATAVATSTGGGFVYVAAREQLALSRFERRAEGLVFGNAVFQYDPGIDGMFEPAAVVPSRDGRSLYVVGDFYGSIALFDRDPANGRVSFVQTAFLQGDGAGDALLSPDDRHLYVLSSFAIFLVSRDGDDLLVEALDIPAGKAPAISPDGRHLYQVVTRVPEFLAQIEVYSRNPSDGKLTHVQTIDTPAPSHPIQLGYDLAFDAEGRHGYLSAVLEDGRTAVLAFGRNTTDGSLSFIEAEIEGVGGVAGLGGSGPLAIAAGGTHVYAAGSADDTLVVFSRNTANGQLQPVQVLREGEDGVSGVAGLSALAAASDGRLYGVSETHSTLVVLRQDG